MTAYSNPQDPAQLCKTCRTEVAAAATRNSFTLHSNITDSDDRARLVREAHETREAGYQTCARCALRPVAP
jgi:hypothetical protein